MARSTFKKKITTDESLQNINPKNKKLQELFLKDKDRKCSEATIKGYSSDLNIFFCWVEQFCDNKYYPEIKKFEISDFFSYCVNELQWNGKRFARMRSVLSNLSEIVIKYYDEISMCGTMSCIRLYKERTAKDENVFHYGHRCCAHHEPGLLLFFGYSYW